MFTYTKENKEGWFDGSDSCYHPWYNEPRWGDDAKEYRLERQFLKQLAPDTVVSYLNGEPTTAEERLHTVEDIIEREGY
jgi:hypothetical protein